MAIRDLLWCCPICCVPGGIAPARGGERCTACGARFSRARGSHIVARLTDGRALVRSAAAWAELLPAEVPLPAVALAEGALPASVPATEAANAAERGEGRGGEAPPGLWRRDRVVARRAVGDEVLRRGREYLGRMERFGPPLAGTLALTDATLELSGDAGERWCWALEGLTALQASSGTVQVKPRGEPIASFSFPESSSRLWEESIAGALRARWRALGRGEIIEFQPLIVTE